MSSPYPYCLATTVSAEALKVLLETSGEGKYRDTHPWLAALDMLDAARDENQSLPVLFASGSPAEFSHWGYVTDLAVVELHRATWETVLSFPPLQPVNPIWVALDSVLLKPTAEQLDREVREGQRVEKAPLRSRLPAAARSARPSISQSCLPAPTMSAPIMEMLCC